MYIRVAIATIVISTTTDDKDIRVSFVTVKIKATAIATKQNKAESAREPAPTSAESTAKEPSANRAFFLVACKKPTSNAHSVAAEVTAQELGFVEGMINKLSGTAARIEPQRTGRLNLRGTRKYVRVTIPTNKALLNKRIDRTLISVFGPVKRLIAQ